MHFGFQFDPALFPRRRLDLTNQRQDLGRGRGPVVDDKISVHVGDPRIADPRAFQTQLIDQLPGRAGGGIFENATGAFRGWLSGAALFLRGVESPDDFFGGRFFSAENCRDGKIGVERGHVPVMHFEFGWRFFVRATFLVEITHPRHLIKSLRAHRTRVHPQAAANRARDSFHPLETADPRGFAGIGDLFQFRADTGRDFQARHFDAIEFPAARMHYDAANSSFAHEQIRTAADDEERHPVSPAKANQVRESLLGSHFHPELRRPADAQGGVLGERFGKPDVAGRAHDFLQSFRDDEFGREHGQLLVHITGAETEHEIAFREHLTHVAMQPVEPRLIRNAAVPVRGNRIGDGLPAHARQRRLARGVNVGHDDAIGIIEGRAKLLPQRLGARIAMGLKHRQDAFAPGRSRGRERGPNLGRMMRIIVHEEKAFALILDLKAAPRMTESA